VTCGAVAIVPKGHGSEAAQQRQRNDVWSGRLSTRSAGVRKRNRKGATAHPRVRNGATARVYHADGRRQRTAHSLREGAQAQPQGSAPTEKGRLFEARSAMRLITT